MNLIWHVSITRGEESHLNYDSYDLSESNSPNKKLDVNTTPHSGLKQVGQADIY